MEKNKKGLDSQDSHSNKRSSQPVSQTTLVAGFKGWNMALLQLSSWQFEARHQETRPEPVWRIIHVMFLRSNFHQNASGSANGLHQINALEGGGLSFVLPLKANFQ